MLRSDKSQLISCMSFTKTISFHLNIAPSLKSVAKFLQIAAPLNMKQQNSQLEEFSSFTADKESQKIEL